MDSDHPVLSENHVPGTLPPGRKHRHFFKNVSFLPRRVIGAFFEVTNASCACAQLAFFDFLVARGRESK